MDDIDLTEPKVLPPEKPRVVQTQFPEEYWIKEIAPPVNPRTDYGHNPLRCDSEDHGADKADGAPGVQRIRC